MTPDDGETTSLAGDFSTITDPLGVELIAATVVANIDELLDGRSEAEQDAVRAAFVADLEATATADAATTLATIGLIDGQAFGELAAACARRLAERGVAPHPSVAMLTTPVTATEFFELSNEHDETIAVAGGFARSGERHSFVVLTSPENCDEATDVVLIPGDRLDETVARIRESGHDDGLTFVESRIGAAQFRRMVEVSLDARDVHDSAPFGEEDKGADSDYRTTTRLLRARLRTLPSIALPEPAHHCYRVDPNIMGRLRKFADSIAAERRERRPEPAPAWDPAAPTTPPRPSKLPPRRKTRDGVAPILRIGVDLAGTFTPILRRIEVPGDIPLATLHKVLQASFDWHDEHPYRFDTEYGEFGRADGAARRRSDTNVTLEQVASAPGARLSYTYADDWRHDILVEESIAPDPSVGPPRCVDARRAAPPENCGGIDMFETLVEVLESPDDDDEIDPDELREAWLERLGLPDDFDWEYVDVDAINAVLATLAPKPRHRRR